MLLLLGAASVAAAEADPEDRHPPLQLFVDAALLDEPRAERALAALDEWWRDDYACMLVDIARFMEPRRAPRRAGGWRGTPGGGVGGGPGSGFGGMGGGAAGRPRGTGAPRPGIGGMGVGTGGPGGGGLFRPGASSRHHPSAKVRERLVRFLEEQTGQDFGDDLRAWRRWYWNLPYAPHPGYAELKAGLYSQVDERMGRLVRGGGAAIRLDEVEWSGRRPTWIPVLEHPKHVAAAEADYLEDNHVVFGVAVGGHSRAYPERILAWHELTHDRLGDTELTIVSDVLCGTVIPFGNEVRGTGRTFVPSSLIYRSNKLIFDEETESLWSTITGEPVLGPATAQEVELQSYPVVTTTWREWRALHPDTTVLSLETGYPFDYSREAPFLRYLRSDWLPFDVPLRDGRLKKKEPVLALVLPQAGGKEAGERRALAIKAKLLEKKRNRVYHTRLAGHELVIVSDRDGAHRVYEAGETRFVARERDGRLRDASRGSWRLEEAGLIPEATDVSPKIRLAARRVLWFAWYAQFPNTELVK